MIFQESSRVRRVVGRLDAGDDCIDAITEFCREHGITAAEVRAVGQLDQVELVRFRSGEGYKPTYEGEGEFDVLHMNGNVAVLGDEPVVRLETVLATDGPVASQIVTGQLRAGRVVEMEFVLDVFDDLEIRRKMNPDTGRLDLHAIKDTAPEEPKERPAAAKAQQPSESADAPAAAESSETASANDDDAEATAKSEAAESDKLNGQSMSWDDAAEESKEAAESEESGDPYADIDLDAPMLEAGDILKHPKLGDCRVMKVEEDEYAHIRLPRGKIRKLSLDVVDPKFVEEEDGRHVFEAQIRQ